MKQRFIIGAVLLLAAGISALGGEKIAGAPAAIIVMQGEVNDYNRATLFRNFTSARAQGARTVILEINTYGGAVKAGLDISRFIKQQKDLHVIAFVGEKAISAGVMIALACDEIVMAPHAMMGDSAPIAVDSGGSLQTMGQTERAKMESPILEDFRDSAIRNGYNPLLAESMVSVGRQVHWIENARGERRFVDAEQYTKLTADGTWKPVPGVRNPIDSKDELLTVNTDLALKLGLAKGTATSVEDLAKQRGLMLIATFTPSLGDEIIAFLGSATVRFLLMTIFSVALYAALHAPGHGGAEATAAIALSLLLGVPLLTGYAQWWEILAVLMGLVLLALEVFVIPGFGVAGILGALLLLGGLLMTFVPQEPGGMPGLLPNLAATWQALQKGLLAVVASMIASLALSAWLSRFLPKVPYFNKLILTTTSGGGVNLDGQSPPALRETAPAWPRVGMIGTAMTDLYPGGAAVFPDETTGDTRIIDVISESGYIDASAKIIVREVEGTKVLVRKAEG